MTVDMRSKSIKTEAIAKAPKKAKISIKAFAYVTALLFLIAANITYLESKHFSGNKIDANKIQSPWEYGGAPPQGFNKKQIVIHSAPKIDVEVSTGNHPKYKLIHAGSLKPRMTIKTKPFMSNPKSKQRTAFAFAQKTYNKNLTE